MAALDTSRLTSGVYLPVEVSNEIWTKAQEASAIMRLASPIEIPNNGASVDIITGDPTASWVNETEERAVSKGSIATKQITPYTMAVTMTFSNEFRENKPALYTEMVGRVPAELAKMYDATVFGNNTKPGENFDQLDSATAVDIETDPWAGLVAADLAISGNNSIANGYCISPKAKSLFLSAKDGMERPLFLNSIAEGNVPTLLGNPTYQSRGCYKQGTPDQLGFLADWTSARYGINRQISMTTTDQATVTVDGSPVNLWQRNMFAVKFEFTVGFRVKDDKDFVKLVGKTA